MKIRKTTWIAIFGAAAMVVGIALALASSAVSGEGLSASNNKDRQLAFGKALWDVFQSGTLPDGSLLDGSGAESSAINNFAVTDVDGDGQDELLLEWIAASMAGRVGYVFGFNGEEFHVELLEFPILTFYDNGAVESEWSHNQGLSGRFWPYFVYRYDRESDVYQSTGFVSAWDRRVRDQNDKGEAFPADIDADGDGLVYYILPADGSGQDEVPPVDGPDYENWRNSYLNGAEKLNIPFEKLTEENIAALGYPKPKVTRPQPVG